MNETFRRWAAWTASALGSSWSFFATILAVGLWLASGPFFGFTEMWQLIANTTISVYTLLLVVLVQNSQNRDSVALQLKLDELIRAVGPASTDMVRLETLTDEELEVLQKRFEKLRKTENGRKRRKAR